MKNVTLPVLGIVIFATAFTALAAEHKMLKVTCEQFATMVPPEKERIYYWYDGYLSNKYGKPIWDFAAVEHWNKALITACKDNKGDYVVDVVEKISK